MLAVQALNRFVHAIEEGAAPSEFYEDIQQAFEMVRRENERISPRLVEKICNYFPGDIGSLNSKALLFDQEGLIIQSVCTYTEILRSTDGQVDVRNDLENIRTHFFDQWHWIMVNDRRRNRAFFEGIREILGIFKENSMESGRSKVNILDLGCGSGLLTVMAAKIAKEIGMDTKFISVDSSRTFGDLAKITCQENEVESEVRTVDSREMESPSEAINLVISETLDCAIFGEGICSSLLDVHRRMRSPGEFRVVPQTAKLFVQLISSATIKKSHYRDMGDHCLISQETYRNFPAPQQAPYDCERMEKIEYQPLSEGVPVIDIDFEDPRQLEAVVGNAVNGEFTVTVTEEGEATALMAWFFLATGPKASLSTDPGRHMCWPQAIFPVHFHQRLPAGTEVQFQYKIEDEKLFIQPKNLAEPQTPFVRADIDFDFKSLNNDALRAFIARFVESSTELVVDASNLAIESSDGKIISRPKSPALQKFLKKSDLDPRQARYLLTWPFSPCGAFNLEDYMADEETLVRFNYTLFPSKLRFNVQLFSSTELAHQCHLVPPKERAEAYCGVNLNSMETLNIRYFEEVVLSRIEWTPCSDPVMAHEIDLGNLAEVIVPRSQTLTLTPHHNSPKSDGILFWIEVLSPSGDIFSFKQHSGEVKAFVFSKPHNVEQQLQVKVDYVSGRLLFTVPELNEPENETFYEKFRDISV